MKGILADINVHGQFETLLNLWQSEEWREIWESLGLSVHSFEELGLPRTVADDVLWQVCQQRQIVLVTANRNDEAPNSLEATIRTQNREDCLPVFTVADAQRILDDRTYAHRVADKLLEHLFAIDRVRGTGRMYVP